LDNVLKFSGLKHIQMLAIVLFWTGSTNH